MNRGTREKAVVGIGAVLALLAWSSAHAAATDAQKCEAGKNGTVGKYAACLAKAQQKFVGGGEADTARRDAAIVSCGTKYAAKFQSHETKAGAGVCPSEGDATSIQDFVDACVFSAADALGGGTLPGDVITCNADLADCGSDLSATNADLATCNSGLATCSSDLATCSSDLSTTNADLASCIAAGPEAKPLKTGQTTCYDSLGVAIPCTGTGQDGALQLGASRSFTDNGDGTITDNKTGLMWEKLSNDGSIHDRDNFYSWGNAFATKVATLNSTAFAGYSDWRMPNRLELETLVNLGAFSPALYSAFNTACPAACTVLTCSCSAWDDYWSSTTRQGGPETAWVVDFFAGSTDANMKSDLLYVRAVRAGS